MSAKNKFFAKKTWVGQVRFDSKLEARRNGELELLQRAGAISGLRRQVTFSLVVNGIAICKMVADHTFFEGKVYVVEEVKTPPTKTPSYRIKRKLFEALYPEISFREWPEVPKKIRKSRKAALSGP